MKQIITSIAFIFAIVGLICSLPTKAIGQKLKKASKYWGEYYQAQLTPELELVEAGPTHTVEKGKGYFVYQAYYYDTKVVLQRRQSTDKEQKKLSGACTYYSMSGKKEREENYVNNKLEGKLRQYNNNVLSAEYTYKQGKLNGLRTYFDEKGNKTEEANFVADSLDGERIYYQADGAVKLRQRWAQGKLIEGTLLPKEMADMTPIEFFESYEVSSLPQFPCNPEFASSGAFCGESSMRAYIFKTMSYPKTARDIGITGRVLVDFVIDKNGKITGAEAIVANCDALRNEALRVINSMPNWTPGQVNGQPVNVRFTLPLTFKLD
jgi:TonB family protein